jgi:hypothetical protein
MQKTTHVRMWIILAQHISFPNLASIHCQNLINRPGLANFFPAYRNTHTHRAQPSCHGSEYLWLVDKTFLVHHYLIGWHDLGTPLFPLQKKLPCANFSLSLFSWTCNRTTWFNWERAEMQSGAIYIHARAGRSNTKSLRLSRLGHHIETVKRYVHR